MPFFITKIASFGELLSLSSVALSCLLYRNNLLIRYYLPIRNHLPIQCQLYCAMQWTHIH